MCVEAELHKSEYESLRQEINTHQTFANALIALELTAIGVGISIGAKSTYALAGLAAVTSMLWLSYMDHLAGMFRIAAYVALVLRPRLSALVGHSVLSWEIFFRHARGGPGNIPGEKRAFILPSERFAEPALGLTYVSVFFGATPPTFTALYVYESLRGRGGVPAVTWVIMAAAVIFWVFALLRFMHMSSWMRRVDALIKAGELQDVEDNGQTTEKEKN